MEETDGPERSGSGSCGTGLPQGSLEGPEEDVKNGKVLVQLDKSAIEEKLVDHDVDFQQTEATFADARQDIEIAESQALSSLKADRQALRFALLDFEKYVGKEASQEILKALGLPGSEGSGSGVSVAPRIAPAALVSTETVA